MIEPKPKDASHDNVDDFNEDTCEVCLYHVENVVILRRTMLRYKSCLKTIKTNQAESKDATQDKVGVFNEDTCNVCLICVLCRIFGPSKVRALPVAASINIVAMVLGIILVRAECVHCP